MIELAFFRSKGGDWSDKIIDFMTGSRGFSHCEIMVGTNETIGITASGNKVSKYYHNDIRNDHRWVVITIPGGEPAKLNKHLEKQMGKPYDFIGVALYSIGLHWYQSRKGLWCSELCHNAVKHSFSEYDFQSDLPMPNELFRNLMLHNGANVSHRLSADGTQKKLKKEIDKYGHVLIDSSGG